MIEHSTMDTDERLRRYQIMEPLGSGGQASTFRAIDRESGREVAVKIHRLGGGGDWRAFDAFERECATLAELSHRGIPEFIDSFSSPATGDYFLVMQLVEGKPLRERVSAIAPRDRAQAIQRWLDQGLEILAYLHRRSPPVIHRDVKPDNIIIGSGDQLWLVDFGGVRRSESDGSDGATVIGTLGYMAPEQSHGQAAPATDIYSLGVTLLSVLTGKTPDQFPRDGLEIDMDALLQLAPVPAPPPLLRARLTAMTRAEAAKRSTKASAGTPPHVPRAEKRPSPETATVEPPSERLPATQVPPIVAQLARTRSPLLRPLLWASSAFGSGALVFLEAVLLPPVFRWLRSNEKSDSPAEQAKNRAKREAFAATVRSSRATLAFLAERTHPLNRDAKS